MIYFKLSYLIRYILTKEILRNNNELLLIDIELRKQLSTTPTTTIVTNLLIIHHLTSIKHTSDSFKWAIGRFPWKLSIL